MSLVVVKIELQLSKDVFEVSLTLIVCGVADIKVRNKPAYD